MFIKKIISSIKKFFVVKNFKSSISDDGISYHEARKQRECMPDYFEYRMNQLGQYPWI